MSSQKLKAGSAHLIGRDAIAAKGYWQTYRLLLLRRLVQITTLGLFLLGPVAGVWLLKGNLSSSQILEAVPLSDPFVYLQTLIAGHRGETTMLIGAAIVAVFYLLVGGRSYCSWVCPINPVTDLSGWLGRRLGIGRKVSISRWLRYWILALSLLLPAITGMVVWELVNPVSLLHRGIIFGMGMGWYFIGAIFLFDLFVLPKGWCGHICPMGAFYSLVGKFSPLRVKASKRDACNDCMDCFAVCPEPQVIKPALKGKEKGVGPVILSPNCTNCGRCIDICSVNVFEYGSRVANLMENQP
ncbi:MAG: quinol dehydrogenase ferredoxin subunit NapH [Motiliproteus sp.]